MTETEPGWEHFRTFLAVLEAGSLSAAARALGLAQPTAGRHIAALEFALKTALFTRAQHGLIPTAAALELRPHAEAMKAAAEALVRTASGEAQAPRGTVRITASEMIGAEVLPPILAGFHARHPGITLELALTDRSENLTRREADIAVRMVRPSQAALVARRIGRVGIWLFAHRDYVAARGLPASLAELAAHSIIGFDRARPGIPSMGPGGVALTRELFAFRSDSNAAQIAALRAGLGVGACQIGIAARDPALVPVLPGLFELGLDMWLAMHEDLRASRRVRLVYDHLAAGLADYVTSGAQAGTALALHPPKAPARRRKGPKNQPL